MHNVKLKVLCKVYMFTYLKRCAIIYALYKKRGVAMYKGQTDARRKASSKYLKDTVETIAFRVPRGEKEKLKDVAERAGLSLNAFISEAVKEKIEKEGL